MKFSEPLRIEIVNYKKYKTVNDVVADGTIVCPKDFTFDVTVPKGVLFILGGLMFSKIIRAVAVHDYEYTVKKNPRKVADVQLRDMMIVDGLNRVSAYIAYFCTRLFGWKYWNKED